jgi:activator of 2-hydroxyglutaryl-CoA dehydratase/predicted nucleotide-binding protein (sugar kinase/HSP70/actin superfamily)
MKKYKIGFDIGSDSVHGIVIDEDDNIFYSPESHMHFGNPAEVLKEVYEKIIDKIGFENINSISFTGSVGKFLAEKLSASFFYDTITIPSGLEVIAPESDYNIHIGAKDSYFFTRENVIINDRRQAFIPDHGTGTKCGGGSGILITKQCRRFYEHLFPIKLGDNKKENRAILQKQLKNIFEKAASEATTAEKFIDVGGRCGVVIQSDMIHLQNIGEQIQNILNGMLWRVVKNYKCDVLKTRTLERNRKAVVTGGVFANRNLAKMFEKEIGVKIEIPKNFEKVGAIGAARKTEGKSKIFCPEDLNSIAQAEREKIRLAPPLSSVLDKIIIYEEKKHIDKKEDLLIYENFEQKDKIEVLIGLDGGSTTTKAIIAKANNLKIVAEICLYTNGRPLKTAQDLFRQIKDNLGEKIVIIGMAYTGSSGAFYHKLFTDQRKNPEKPCLDIIKDEITCHALGVKHFNSNVDTIFELGGQDAKFTLFNKDGTVKKSKMNLSCMAGTGQTMHNMVEMLGLDIKTTFHEHALLAKNTPVVDETCGVFTEAGIAKLIATGFPKEEIAAAIAYGFMGGYVNKFVGNEKFGKYASAQGGPFNGKSCLAALALHTGLEIHAFPHRQLFGSLGAVIAIKNRMKRLEKEGVKFESKFRGLGIANTFFEKRVETCSKIVKDSCTIRDCKLQVYRIGEDMIYSGGLCPKGNTETLGKKAPNYVENYKRILDKHLNKYSIGIDQKTEKIRILIPRSLSFLNEKGVFYSALYNKLGFDVAISPESDEEIAGLGINYAHSETCFPVKLAHGHAAYLKEHFRSGKDKILFVNTIASGKERYKYCPYVAAAGFLAKDAIQIDNKDALLPVFHFDNPVYKLEKNLDKDLKRVFGKKFDIKKIRNAIFKAQKAEKEFLDEIYETGEKTIAILKKKGEKIFIGVGRGYTVLDNKASSKIHELFASNGLHFIPALFLKEPNYDIEDIVENMFWVQGKKMIRYSLMIAMDSSLYPVRETNFNCGTDSFILYHEVDIMNRSGKPYLLLQTDGHNSNAQFGTRTLANFEVVKNHQALETEINEYKKKAPVIEFKNRTIGVPQMGDSANVLVGAFRALGFKSELIATQTKMSQELARKFVTTNTCRPFSFQLGDTLAWLYELKEKGIDPNKNAAVFEPKAKGPCRFGQYSVMLRRFFDENGFTGVPVISPDGDNDYNDIPLPRNKLLKLLTLCIKGFICNDILYDALLRTRPYEKEEGMAEKVYDKLRQLLYGLIEKNASTSQLVSFLNKAKIELEKLIDPKKERRPLVAMNGEIFVRCHPKANQDSIKLLEKFGLEIVMATPSQWIEYVNKCSLAYFKQAGEWKKWAASLIKKGYIKNINRRLFAPFSSYLSDRKPHDPEHIIDSAQNAFIYEKLISGESPLSIGEAYMFAQGKTHNISGIYHVGPFGCMHETTATSQIQSLIQKKRTESKNIEERIIPFMDGVFGDSELPNLEAEIAAFADKCYLKQKLNSKSN